MVVQFAYIIIGHTGHKPNDTQAAHAGAGGGRICHGLLMLYDYDIYLKHIKTKELCNQ